jgi:hypothetical protein
MDAIRKSFLLGATALLVACATSAPAPAPDPPPTVPAVPATVDATTTPGGMKIPEGYVKANVNGEVRYCRNDMNTGSRVQRTQVCLTELQLKEVQENSQNFLNDVQGRYGLIRQVTGAPPGMSSTGGMGH